jgi:hypothetical protein
VADRPRREETENLPRRVGELHVQESKDGNYHPEKNSGYEFAPNPTLPACAVEIAKQRAAIQLQSSDATEPNVSTNRANSVDHSKSLSFEGSPRPLAGTLPGKMDPPRETESVGCWLLQKRRESCCAQVQAKSSVLKNELPFCSRIPCSNVGAGPSVFPTFDDDRRYCASERTRVLPDTDPSLGASRAASSNDDYDLPTVFFAAVGRYLRRIASRS